MSSYKYLTPAYRREILSAIDKQIAELETCQQNLIILEEIRALKIFKKLIASLPDGYLIPVKE